MKKLNKALSLLLTLLMIVFSSATCAFAASASTTKTTTTTSTTAASKTTTAAKKSQTTTATSTTTATTAKTQTAKISAGNEIVTSYNDPKGRVLCVAHQGDPRNFPENSLEGVQSCISMGVDIVEVDVQRTKDGQFVLMKDKDLSRMCTTTDGKSEATARVSEETLADLLKFYYLRAQHGGATAASTEYQIATLKDAIKACKGKCMLMINGGFAYASEINTLARSLGATDYVIIKKAADTSKIQSFKSSAGLPVCHICAYYSKSTSDMSAKKYVSTALEAGADSVQLVSDKSYDSIFRNSVLRKFETGRAFVSMTSLSQCGGKQDREQGWSELIDDGYSMIETDYPQELVDYITRTENARTKLSSLITQAQSIDTDNYSDESAKALKASLKSAQETAAKGCVSYNSIDSARYALQESIDSLETGPEKTSSNAGIIAIVIIVIIAAAAAVILILRYKNKKNRGRPGDGTGTKSRKNKYKSSPAYTAPPEDDDHEFDDLR